MAQTLRLVISLAGALIAIWVALVVQSNWLGFILSLLIFLGCGAIAERVFRSLAKPGQIRDDLEQRTRSE